MRRRIAALIVGAICASTMSVAMTAGAAPASASPSHGCSRLVGVAVHGYEETRGGKFAGPTLNVLRKKLKQRIDLHAIRYQDPYYNKASKAAGRARLTAYLHATARRCPHTYFVLAGYSEGALVVGNVLHRHHIESKHILGAVMFGDPRFNGRQSFDRGSYNHALNGFDNPRYTAALRPFASRVRSYCRSDDVVCQPGGPGGEGHTNYYPYLDGAADFLAHKIRAATH